MQRIIDGYLYEGVRSETEWAVTRWRGNGHAETSIRPAVIWTEVGHVDDFPPVKRPSYPLEDALKCLEKAARRAQTKIGRASCRERVCVPV